jgi:hypothetical protein
MHYMSVRRKWRAARAEAAAEEAKRELERKKQELEAARVEKELKDLALIDFDQFVEDYVPEDLRPKLLKSEHIHREHVPINSRRKEDLARWAQGLLGNGILTEDEHKRLDDHFKALREEAKGRLTTDTSSPKKS